MPGSATSRRVTLSCSLGSVRAIRPTQATKLARIIGQVRQVGRDMDEVPRLHPHMLAKSIAVPHAGFTGENIHCAFMLLVQVWLRPALGRDGDQVHPRPLRTGCLRGTPFEIVQSLLPAVWFSALDYDACLPAGVVHIFPANHITKSPGTHFANHQ